MAGTDRGLETREELVRLIAGAVRVHLPFVDEATARAIADTALRALAAGTGRTGGVGGGAAGRDSAAGRDWGRLVRRWRRQRGGWPWWAVGGALLAMAGVAGVGLMLARVVVSLLGL